MKIDAHHHFWRYQPGGFDWIPPQQSELFRDFLPEEFSKELRSVEFDRSIVIQARQSLEETRWLLGLADRWPFLAGVVGWVDLCSPEVEAQIQEFVGHPKFVGVRHVVHGEPDDFLGRQGFRHGISVLQDYGLVYDLLIFRQHMARAVDLVERFPKQVFVLDHLAKPWAGSLSRRVWKEHLGALANHPNVHAKLTGLVPEGYPASWSKRDIGFYLDTAFEAFGEGRLMLGSNWPVCLPVGSYSWVLRWILDYLEVFPAATKEKVWGGNAATIYRLGLGDSSDSHQTVAGTDGSPVF